MVEGRTLGALGITEPSAGSNVSGIKTKATRTAKGWELTGEKMFITNSLNADIFFIAAKTDAQRRHRGISMFLVPSELPRLPRRRNARQARPARPAGATPGKVPQRSRPLPSGSKGEKVR